MPSINFNKYQLIDQLNAYLRLKNRSMTLPYRYCHGLSLLWLHHMMIDDEQWFYTVAQQIAISDINSLNAMEGDIDYFISSIEWIQHSRQYTSTVNQLDIEKLTEHFKEFSLSLVLHHSQLEAQLRVLFCENKTLFISSNDHTVSLVKKNNTIYLFNDRYDQLKPKIINDIHLLTGEIIRCLFRVDYLPDCRLPLHVYSLSAMALPENTAHIKSKQVFKQLIMQCADIDMPGLNGITNMFLACESGNKMEVKQLLKHHSNPNKPCYESWTPLHVAVSHGYRSIAKLLIKFGAIVAIENNAGVKPVDIARERGDNRMVRMLL